jgi:hypothetical protein
VASSPYFDSAGMQIDSSKKALLEAVATGGTAGKQAFDAAQAQAAQAKQEAVARAAERSSLLGIGGDNQTFLGAYDARANQMGVNRANFESGLAQTQASGESYMEKARASIPILQSININKGADEETKIKLAIQAAKDKAAAEAEKEARTLQRQLDAEARAEARAIAKEGRAAGRASAKENQPSLNALLGAAGQVVKSRPGLLSEDGTTKSFGGPRMRIGGGPGVANIPATTVNITDLAFQLGQAYGVNDNKLMELYSPSQQSSLKTATGKLAPTPPKESKDAIAAALATKYDTKGVDYNTAKSVVNNVDFQAAVKWLLNGADGKTRDEVENILRENFINRDGRNWTAEYNILLGEYLGAIPAA